MIRLLDETTVGQIAAGEVVDRPLSVVKELVENALDSGASRIAVALARGGLDAIEVLDDGAGIPSGELALAFARHATSKLNGASDLGRITTLGFRGEGLASIAAVARVRLASRVAADDVGFTVDAFDGTVSPPEPVATPPGTRVAVTDLFANVPVRREYLRSPAAEFARVSIFLATLTLGYPQVAFSLAHDGRTTWIFPRADSLEQRLAQVFGLVPARALIPLEGAGDANSPLFVRGFVSRPGQDRPDRRMQHLFVNGRLLRTTLLAGAWSAGYSTYALVGRQPYGVLFLDIPPDQVDANVHPTKSDVRLRFPERVTEAVRRAIAETLARDANERLRSAVSFAPDAPLRMAGAAPGSGGAADAAGAASFEFAGEPPLGASGTRVVAQLDDTYILALDRDALVLVDQHAAHERIAYEAIVQRARERAPSEPLLVPYLVELDAAQVPRFEAIREAMAEAGFVAEPFGDNAYRVVATPAGYGARRFDLRPFLADVGDEIPGLSPHERIWATLACHSVVRAGDRLELAEMSALIARLEHCANPMHCPHGRPTVVRIGAADVARMFKRT
jgi:DNA mismatch repair protein MutL